ncbi:hypothetical protein WA158_003380 [Blastocystis sp. Blastoise]
MPYRYSSRYRGTQRTYYRRRRYNRNSNAVTTYNNAVNSFRTNWATIAEDTTVGGIANKHKLRHQLMLVAKKCGRMYVAQARTLLTSTDYTIPIQIFIPSATGDDENAKNIKKLCNSTIKQIINTVYTINKNGIKKEYIYRLNGLLYTYPFTAEPLAYDFTLPIYYASDDFTKAETILVFIYQMGGINTFPIMYNISEGGQMTFRTEPQYNTVITALFDEATRYVAAAQTAGTSPMVYYAQNLPDRLRH